MSRDGLALRAVCAGKSHARHRRAPLCRGSGGSCVEPLPRTPLGVLVELEHVGPCSLCGPDQAKRSFRVVKFGHRGTARCVCPSPTGGLVLTGTQARWPVVIGRVRPCETRRVIGPVTARKVILVSDARSGPVTTARSAPVGTGRSVERGWCAGSPVRPRSHPLYSYAERSARAGTLPEADTGGARPRSSLVAAMRAHVLTPRWGRARWFPPLRGSGQSYGQGS